MNPSSDQRERDPCFFFPNDPKGGESGSSDLIVFSFQVLRHQITRSLNLLEILPAGRDNSIMTKVRLCDTDRVWKSEKRS